MVRQVSWSWIAKPRRPRVCCFVSKWPWSVRMRLVPVCLPRLSGVVKSVNTTTPVCSVTGVPQAGARGTKQLTSRHVALLRGRSNELDTVRA